MPLSDEVKLFISKTSWDTANNLSCYNWICKFIRESLKETCSGVEFIVNNADILTVPVRRQGPFVYILESEGRLLLVTKFTRIVGLYTANEDQEKLTSYHHQLQRLYGSSVTSAYRQKQDELFMVYLVLRLARYQAGADYSNHLADCIQIWTTDNYVAQSFQATINCMLHPSTPISVLVAIMTDIIGVKYHDTRCLPFMKTILPSTLSTVYVTKIQTNVDVIPCQLAVQRKSTFGEIVINNDMAAILFGTPHAVHVQLVTTKNPETMSAVVRWNMQQTQCVYIHMQQKEHINAWLYCLMAVCLNNWSVEIKGENMVITNSTKTNRLNIPIAMLRELGRVHQQTMQCVLHKMDIDSLISNVPNLQHKTLLTDRCNFGVGMQTCSAMQCQTLYGLDVFADLQESPIGENDELLQMYIFSTLDKLIKRNLSAGVDILNVVDHVLTGHRVPSSEQYGNRVFWQTMLRAVTSTIDDANIISKLRILGQTRTKKTTFTKEWDLFTIGPLNHMAAALVASVFTDTLYTTPNVFLNPIPALVLALTEEFANDYASLCPVAALYTMPTITYQLTNIATRNTTPLYFNSSTVQKYASILCVLTAMCNKEVDLYNLFQINF